jgi:hypothetical protein
MRFRNLILALLALYAVWVAGVLSLAFYEIARAKQQGRAEEPTEAFASRDEESEQQYREFLNGGQKPSREFIDHARELDHAPAKVQEAVPPK